MIAVRVSHDHCRWTAWRCRGERSEMRRVPDAGIDQDGRLIANQIGPVAIAGHRPGVGGVQEARRHPGARRRPATDSAKAISINTAALTYGVVMP